MVDRNVVYRGKCLIGPHIQRLLDEQAKILEEMETAFVATRALTIAKHLGAARASIEEIAEEMAFFLEVLQCYDVCFALLRRTRELFTVEDNTELQRAIDKLQRLWPTQRNWEEKEASVTPNRTTCGSRLFLNWRPSISWRMQSKSSTSSTDSRMRFIVTFGITNSARSARRNKKPPPGTL
jgi:hypothetical protein